MANLTTAFPRRTGDDKEDLKRLYDWSVSLTDELKQLLCNLDSGNVSEASKVSAQNIDCSKAKIKDAQIKSLTADKLTAGTIDTGEITVTNDNDYGSVLISGDSIIFKEKKGNVIRIAIGRDVNNKYIFLVQNSDETQGIEMTSDGNIVLTGSIDTTKDCRIQGELRVGMSGNMKGIAFYGAAYQADENGNYATPYGQFLPWVDSYDDKVTGVEFKGGKFIVNNSPVATEEKIAPLQEQIEKLQEQIDTLV